MENAELLDNAFDRICVFIEKCGMMIARLGTSNWALYRHKDAYATAYIFTWRSKKHLLLGDTHPVYSNLSMFSWITDYQTFTFAKSHAFKFDERFISVCKYLNKCDSLEELALKMDLLGI